MTILNQRTPNPVVFCDFHMDAPLAPGFAQEIAADTAGYASRGLKSVESLADHESVIATLVDSAVDEHEIDDFAVVEVEATWSFAQLVRIEVRAVSNEYANVAVWDADAV